MSAQALARAALDCPDPTAPLVVSYGMGVDSTGVLVLLARAGVVPDAITFADTGGEKPETYDYLPTINAWCVRVGFPEVTVVRYGTAQARNGGAYSTLEENCLVNATLPGIVFGFGGGTYGKSCSQKWKVGPQDRWTRRWEPAQAAWKRGAKVVRIIGYDCSPADAKRSTIPDDARYRYWYLLREAGLTRDAIKELIASEGLPVPPKSACWFCPATTPGELREFVAAHPEYVERIVAMERAAVPSLDRKVEGLWGRPVVGRRDPSRARPGSMTEFVTGEPLVTVARLTRLKREAERTEQRRAA